MATDPPSYESVIASIAAQIPSNASPAKILDTVKSITPEQATVIAANTEKTQWNPSDHQKAQFILGVAKAITSSDLEEQLRKSSQDAVDAIVSINGMFTDLTARLAHIDQLVDNDQDPFTPKLQTLRKRFRDDVQASQDFADEIAVFGQQFDTSICQVCADTSIAISDRIKILERFIAKVKDLEDRAPKIGNAFDDLVSDFAAFTGTFSAWAVKKENSDNAELTQAKRLQTAMLAMGISSGVGLLVFATIATMSGPFAPAVLIGGLLFAGLTATAAVALYFAAEKVQDEIKAKNDQVATLTQQISDIQTARADLVQLGQQDLTDMQTKAAFVTTFFTSLKHDLNDVASWLQNGADAAESPAYMKMSCDEACHIYDTMAKYLQEYANGVRPSH